ncbi:MAG TPA: T9SS type A sorting domain-containing protein, partial [Flavisolibacter sp.]|nr:T9SS type A sorting domain-containing protein [Flavisolibacter sp.]
IKILVSRLVMMILIGSVFFLYHPTRISPDQHLNSFVNGMKVLGENEENDDHEEEYSKERLYHEFEMLRNPVTGQIPANFHEIELQAASLIPRKNNYYNPLISGINGTGSVTNQNSYQSVGPNNAAGRSRALGIDRRNAKIMITGGTTGGIFRSTDGGDSWNFVESEDDIRSVNSITQDPANPDTWYVGTGEVYYTYSTADIAGTVGYGMFKSTNNGLTWTKLHATEDGNQHQFNGFFDYVHRLAVHPTTSAVYAAVHNRIMKSVDGGLTWKTVLGGTVGNTGLGGLTEIIIPSDGSNIFAAFSGENADRGLVGVWQSASGDTATWTRIAGGKTLGVDSVAGWQPYGKWGRVVLALNRTNTQLFVFYKNGKDATAGQPEADLYRANVTTGNPATYTWTNLDAYVQDEPNYTESGIDPYTTQFNGFNMSLTVKPDNDNILFEGGTVLERVDLSQTDPTKKFRRVGGYGKGFFTSSNTFLYPNHHPDIHGIIFPPNTSDTMLTVSDGGVHKTTSSVMADTVKWSPMVNNLQTLQYQFINIYPDIDADWIIGGAQDNGTYVNLNAPADLQHQQIGSGDGASAAISRFDKTGGSVWKQYWYITVSQGTLYRSNFIWNYDAATNNLNYVSNLFDDITPPGLAGQGQWLTLILNDPDSTEHLYYNSKNRLFRTTAASKVTSATWTEMTGVKNTLASTAEFSSMAISKRKNKVKYLVFGTNTGKVYRLDSANTASAAAIPKDITPSGMAANSYVAGVAINPRNPDTVMVVVSNYDQGASVINNIFWTGNGTSAQPSWQVLDGALEPVSSQSCAIVVKNTGVEYYVGTSVGLYSTTGVNGNNTAWVNEGSGLMKTAIIRSLVNRQLDNTLVVGTHGSGAFLSSIGNAVVISDSTATIPTNGSNFITSVYPTVTSGIINYTVGNAALSRFNLRIFAINGQQMYSSVIAYQNGTIDFKFFAKGAYILSFTSDDGKYKYVKKVIKD